MEHLPPPCLPMPLAVRLGQWTVSRTDMCHSQTRHLRNGISPLFFSSPYQICLHLCLDHALAFYLYLFLCVCVTGV
jgi:hypothetical protein